MAKCSLCVDGIAEVHLTYAGLRLCPNCFKDFFVKRIKRTIERYRMINKGDVIGVAISGGKDSGSLLHSLRMIYPDAQIIALHINLGIRNYSEDCERKVRELTRMLDVDLLVYDLRKREGYTIEDFKMTRYGKKMCSVCGIIKRHVMNVMANEAGVDVLATGHNLDDMVEAMFSTLISGDLDQLIRLKPVLPSTHPKLKKKVKPLFKTPEVEDLLYAAYNDIPIREKSCKFSLTARSLIRKRMINNMAEGSHSFKYQLLSVFLDKLIPLIEEKKGKVVLRECKMCGYPSQDEICSRCKRVQALKSLYQSEGSAIK